MLRPALDRRSLAGIFRVLSSMRIAVDVMGGDHGCGVVIAGAKLALEANKKITALYLVEKGMHSLDENIRFLPTDRILPQTHSPLQDKYPEANVDVPLRELLRLAISESDNVAADMILRVIGGPPAVNGYMSSIGVSGFHLEDGEDVLARDLTAQYRNWFEPAGAVQLLSRIRGNSPLTGKHTEMLLQWMKDSSSGLNRIKRDLPPGTIVMHKTGSSGTHDGLTAATNDIGLIALPDGRRLAIAIFVTDSTADDDTRDAVIARIAQAAYDASLQLEFQPTKRGKAKWWQPDN